MSRTVLQTNVDFSNDWDYEYCVKRAIQNPDATKAAVHFSTDPITGEREIAVFTDDGFGNGSLMFKFPLL